MKKNKKDVVLPKEIKLPDKVAVQVIPLNAQIQKLQQEVEAIIRAFGAGREIDEKVYVFQMSKMAFVKRAAVDPLGVRR